MPRLSRALSTLPLLLLFALVSQPAQAVSKDFHVLMLDVAKDFKNFRGTTKARRRCDSKVMAAVATTFTAGLAKSPVTRFLSGLLSSKKNIEIWETSESTPSGCTTTVVVSWQRKSSRYSGGVISVTGSIRCKSCEGRPSRAVKYGSVRFFVPVYKRGRGNRSFLKPGTPSKYNIESECCGDCKRSHLIYRANGSAIDPNLIGRKNVPVKPRPPRRTNTTGQNPRTATTGAKPKPKPKKPLTPPKPKPKKPCPDCEYEKRVVKYYERRLANLKKSLADAKQDLANTDGEIAAKEGQIKALETQLDNQRGTFAEGTRPDGSRVRAENVGNGQVRVTTTQPDGSSTSYTRPTSSSKGKKRRIQELKDELKDLKDERKEQKKEVDRWTRLVQETERLLAQARKALADCLKKPCKDPDGKSGVSTGPGVTVTPVPLGSGAPMPKPCPRCKHRLDPIDDAQHDLDRAERKRDKAKRQFDKVDGKMRKVKRELRAIDRHIRANKGDFAEIGYPDGSKVRARDNGDGQVVIVTTDKNGKVTESPPRDRRSSRKLRRDRKKLRSKRDKLEDEHDRRKKDLDRANRTARDAEQKLIAAQKALIDCIRKHCKGVKVPPYRVGAVGTGGRPVGTGAGPVRPGGGKRVSAVTVGGGESAVAHCFVDKDMSPVEVDAKSGGGPARGAGGGASFGGLGGIPGLGGRREFSTGGVDDPFEKNQGPASANDDLPPSPFNAGDYISLVPKVGINFDLAYRYDDYKVEHKPTGPNRGDDVHSFLEGDLGALRRNRDYRGNKPGRTERGMMSLIGLKIPKKLAKRRQFTFRNSYLVNQDCEKIFPTVRIVYEVYEKGRLWFSVTYTRWHNGQVVEHWTKEGSGEWSELIASGVIPVSLGMGFADITPEQISSGGYALVTHWTYEQDKQVYFQPFVTQIANGAGVTFSNLEIPQVGTTVPAPGSKGVGPVGGSNWAPSGLVDPLGPRGPVVRDSEYEDWIYQDLYDIFDASFLRTGLAKRPRTPVETSREAFAAAIRDMSRENMTLEHKVELTIEALIDASGGAIPDWILTKLAVDTLQADPRYRSNMAGMMRVAARIMVHSLRMRTMERVEAQQAVNRSVASLITDIKPRYDARLLGLSDKDIPNPKAIQDLPINLDDRSTAARLNQAAHELYKAYREEDFLDGADPEYPTYNSLYGGCRIQMTF